MYIPSIPYKPRTLSTPVRQQFLSPQTPSLSQPCKLTGILRFFGDEKLSISDFGSFDRRRESNCSVAGWQASKYLIVQVSLPWPRAFWGFPGFDGKSWSRLAFCGVRWLSRGRRYLSRISEDCEPERMSLGRMLWGYSLKIDWLSLKAP